ncbi:MAG: hypothetical protein ABI571_08450 [Actinomycetota bacterium]
MVKRLFWIAVGAAIALQFDRWWQARSASFTPNALTGTFLDSLNRKLENKPRQA